MPIDSNKVSKSGHIFQGIELTLLLYYTAIGIYFSAREDFTMVLEHVVGSLHFGVFVTLTLMIEHYRELKLERAAQKRGALATAATATPEADPHQPASYLFSWQVAVIVPMITDIFMLARVAAGGLHAVEPVLEFVYCVLALTDAAAIECWSIWVLVKSRMLVGKLLRDVDKKAI